MNDITQDISGAEIAHTLDVRSKLSALGAAMIPMPQLDIPLQHTFAPGLYVREMHMPAGSLVLGKIHNHDHIVIIASGDCTVYSKDGLQRLKGPCTVTYSAGTQRAIYAHADTHWLNVHAVNTNDVGQAEAYLVTEEYPDTEWLIAAAKQITEEV